MMLTPGWWIAASALLAIPFWIAAARWFGAWLWGAV